MKQLVLSAVILLSALALSPALNAQIIKTPDEAPLPSVPWPPRMPERASWTTRIKPTHGLVATGSGVSAGQRPSGIQEITVTKTWPLVHELQVDDAGNKWDKWYRGGLNVILRDNLPPIIFTAMVNNPVLFKDYSSSDFEELKWTSLANYKGIVSLQGHSYYYFTAKKQLTTPGHYIILSDNDSESAASSKHYRPDPRTVPQTPVYAIRAYFDTDTLFPFQFIDGSQQYEYGINAPPTVALELPPAAEAAIAAEKHPKPFNP